MVLRRARGRVIGNLQGRDVACPELSELGCVERLEVTVHSESLVDVFQALLTVLLRCVLVMVLLAVS